MERREEKIKKPNLKKNASWCVYISLKKKFIDSVNTDYVCKFSCAKAIACKILYSNKNYSETKCHITCQHGLTMIIK